MEWKLKVETIFDTRFRLSRPFFFKWHPLICANGMTFTSPEFCLPFVQTENRPAIVMQIFGGKLNCKSVERVFLYIYVNYFFGRVRYCVTFIVAVGTLLFVIKLIR